MLHYILVKWNPDVEKQSAAQAVRALYAKAAEIAGVRRAEFRRTSHRRTIGMILQSFWRWMSTLRLGSGQLHPAVKQKYRAHIEKKCIFDCAGGMEESIATFGYSRGYGKPARKKYFRTCLPGVYTCLFGKFCCA